MSNFSEINLNKQLQNAISDLGFSDQTPIQEKTYSKILGGKDLVGIGKPVQVKLLLIVCHCFKS